MANTSAGQWVKFFNAAGVPSPAAATYAHIFVENRIQIDMLMDLNKEYLREMGITLLGDIIAILRHAKLVCDQNAREKVLGSEIAVPIAAIPANPIGPKENPTKIQLKSVPSAVASLVRQPRCVLPEHDGKYKIKLPTGKTERSKEVLGKRNKLCSGHENMDKLHIRHRPSATSNQKTTDVVIDESETSSDNAEEMYTSLLNSKQIESNGGNRSSSIFSRLGRKPSPGIMTADGYFESNRQVKPILKSSSKSVELHSLDNGSTAPILKKQKVMLVKKVPLKAASGDDYSENEMNFETATSDNDIVGNEKFVKFAATAEVREIAPTPSRPSHSDGRGVKSRLGLGKLHSTKRTYNLKAAPVRLSVRSPIKSKSLRMKSDELLLQKALPVHKRLGHNLIPSTPTASLLHISRGIGKVKISNSSSKEYKIKSNNSKNKSVFDRLGFNK